MTSVLDLDLKKVKFKAFEFGSGSQTRDNVFAHFSSIIYYFNFFYIIIVAHALQSL